MQKGKEQKPHIGIYGRRNYGKSSFINCITGQDIAIVSDVAGTTTDPVKKSYEITGFGPVILIDTAGLDDEGEIG
ncbi:MAG: [FeFe] hydrogenase H-cluster maturation GTPase HydF, partial [Bacteroidales bacterium]|nr:[FeFe] hydrogenase H-cluster maturation GTPase HydF [Bacteroidales bacterium]